MTVQPRTLAPIKPEILQALDSLLDKATKSEEARVMRAAPLQFSGSYQQKHYKTETQ